jgi:hypothetical protein
MEDFGVGLRVALGIALEVCPTVGAVVGTNVAVETPASTTYTEPV